MAIEFRKVLRSPLELLSVSAPGGAVIGLLGESGCGATELLRLAAGLDRPDSGEVVADGTRRYLAATGELNTAPVGLLLIDHTFAQADALVRAQGMAGVDRLRAAGATVLVASHEPGLLRSVCDEVWWLDCGRLAARGDPGEVLTAYNRRIAEKFRAWGDRQSTPMAPAFRKGDGRAEILSLETLGASGKPTGVLQSGEEATVRVVVRYLDAAPNPVVGIMIRTRIGLEVYGTNSELENIKLGPCSAGDTVRLDFQFRCELCPKEYSLTVASHDPDGAAHDWLDDAVSFVVADSRFTAGVANLRARVTVARG